MKKYILILMMLVAVALTFAACGEEDTTITPAPIVTTTTEKLTEIQPTGVKLGEVADAATPVERFASHPALLLWEDSANIPGNESGNVTPPTIEPYLVEGGAGVFVLLQGTSDDGGYYISEGAPVAEYLNSLGYNVFICKYRLTDSYTDAVAEDLRRAVRYVSYHAETFGIGGQKLITMGFGTGALLAYIEACDATIGAPGTDDIDAASPAPLAVLLFNPDMTPESGMFASAAAQTVPGRQFKMGIFYDSDYSNAADTLRFGFTLANDYKLLYTEIHGADIAGEYKAGGDRTESYASLYELMGNYIKTYFKFK